MTDGKCSAQKGEKDKHPNSRTVTNSSSGSNRDGLIDKQEAQERIGFLL